VGAQLNLIFSKRRFNSDMAFATTESTFAKTRHVAAPDNCTKEILLSPQRARSRMPRRAQPFACTRFFVAAMSDAASPYICGDVGEMFIRGLLFKGCSNFIIARLLQAGSGTQRKIS